LATEDTAIAVGTAIVEASAADTAAAVSVAVPDVVAASEAAVDAAADIAKYHQ
jgi:hypothetical protein